MSEDRRCRPGEEAGADWDGGDPPIGFRRDPSDAAPAWLKPALLVLALIALAAIGIALLAVGGDALGPFD